MLLFKFEVIQICVIFCTNIEMASQKFGHNTWSAEINLKTQAYKRDNIKTDFKIKVVWVVDFVISDLGSCVWVLVNVVMDCIVP
jgi:hypothetical protein